MIVWNFIPLLKFKKWKLKNKPLEKWAIRDTSKTYKVTTGYVS